MFITLEGGEGAGKSTQIKRLGAHLAAAGRSVVMTREPGGSPTAEQIRAVLLDPRAADMDATTQALLFAAARRDHLNATILPALARGAVVICDRFIDSTRAYQGAGGLDPAVIRTLEGIAIGPHLPDLTLMLDVPVEIGMARAALRHGAALASSDRFERQTPAFHTRVRDHFRAIVEAEPERCVLVDASGTPDATFAAVLALVLPRLTAREAR